MAQQPSNEGRRARTIPNGSSSSRPAQRQQAQPNSGMVDQALQQFQQLPPDQQQQVMQFAMQNFPRTAQNASRVMAMLNNNPEYADRAINESRNGSFSPHAFRGQPDPHEPVPIFELIGRSINPTQAAPQQAQTNVPSPPTRPTAARSNTTSRTSQPAARTTPAPATQGQQPETDASGNEVAFQAQPFRQPAVGNASSNAVASSGANAAAPDAGQVAKPVAASATNPVRQVFEWLESNLTPRSPVAATTAAQQPAPQRQQVFRGLNAASRSANAQPAPTTSTTEDEAIPPPPAQSWIDRIQLDMRNNPQPNGMGAHTSIDTHMQNAGDAVARRLETVRVNALPITNAIRRAQGQPEQGIPEAQPNASQGLRINPELLRKGVNTTRDSSDVGDGIERYADQLLNP